MQPVNTTKTLEEKYRDYARMVVWYPCAEREVRDKDQFLVFLLAHAGDKTLKQAIMDLEIRKEDFRRALKKARPGIFIYESDWKRVNKMVGLHPPLPFPRLDLAKEREEFEQFNAMDSKATRVATTKK